MLSISAVNAFENTENSTDIIDDNATIVDNINVANESDVDLNESTQTDLTKNESSESKSISLTPLKLSTTYGSGSYFKVKVMDSKTKKSLPNVDIILKVQSMLRIQNIMQQKKNLV